MTSKARHECLLLLAAFRDGGLPSSGSPPEIILISLLTTLSLGSVFPSVDFSGLSAICLVLLQTFLEKLKEVTSILCVMTVLLMILAAFEEWDILSEAFNQCHEGCLTFESVDLSAFRVEAVQIVPHGLFRLLHDRVEVQAGFREPSPSGEVFQKTSRQVGEAFNTSEAFRSTILLSKASR
ncbi:hypothetical protein PIB30_023100 [Stylosanthes scabra]|uniref:Uncharacterized protein n=1 Tax=Stylosanthes scabra TaxID=79078 RepID=A0ABU6Z9S5_9FABA|nr:hypothetical protein [Stylosanthes scabra]